MEHTTFATRLKTVMQARGFKQVDVINRAQISGVKLGKSHISQYVSGKTVPRADIMHFLAVTLDVDESWLRTGESSLPPNIDVVKNTANTDVAADTTAVSNGSVAAAASTATSFAAQPNTTPSIAVDNTALSFAPSSSTLPSSTASSLNASQSKGTPMRRFSKSTKLDNVLYDVRGPVAEEAARMEAEGTNVLKLNIGNPAPFGFRAPDEVVYDMRRQLAECEGYSPAKGLFSARKAIMQYAQIKNLPNVTMEDIYTGNGVSELINMCMSALLDDGDEVLVPSPDYPLWTACVNLAGGTAVHYVCDEQSEWNPDIDDIRSKITDRTKAIVIINPNNPTGALYPKEILEQIVEIARQNQLIIFSDEIYDRLVMDGLEHISIASLAPDLFCVTFSGLSKSHMVAGYRVGWMILSGDKNMAADYIEGLNMLSNMRLCSNVPAQSVVQTALGGYQSVNSYIVPGGRICEQRDYIYEALNSIPGVTAVKPKAAFYIFPKIDVKRFNITDDEQFALDLLRDKKMLVVQGHGFNWTEPDHFRIVYLPRIEVLKDATDRLTDFLSYYHQ